MKRDRVCEAHRRCGNVGETLREAGNSNPIRIKRRVLKKGDRRFATTYQVPPVSLIHHSLRPSNLRPGMHRMPYSASLPQAPSTLLRAFPRKFIPIRSVASEAVLS